MSLITGIGQTGSFTGLYEALKVVFDDPLNVNLIEDTEVYDIFNQDMDVQVKDTPGGRYIEMSHYAADGGGFGARREGGALPQASPPTVFLGQINLRKNHMTVEMTGEVMRRVKAGEAAWLTWASQTLPNAVRRLAHHFDRQALGYGQGVIGRVSAAYVSGNSFIIDRAYGITGYSNAQFGVNVNDFIRASSTIDGAALRANRMRVINVDLATGTVTVDAASTALAAGDFIAIGDSADTNFLGGALPPKEMMGLLGIVDDGSVLTTFQNVLRAARAEYRAQSVNTTTFTADTTKQSRLTEDALIFADDQAFELGMGKPDIILGTRGQERQYARTLRQVSTSLRLLDPRNYTNQGGKNRGFTINLNGRDVQFRVARKIPNQIAFMVERATLKKWQNGNGFSWDDTTGSLFERVVDSTGRYDAYYATGVVEAELGCIAPRKNVILRNIDITLQ